MGWMGSHYSPQSKSALRFLTPVHCKKCKYRARLHWDHNWFGEFECGGCGQKFPAEEIHNDRWYYDMRAQYPNLK